MSHRRRDRLFYLEARTGGKVVRWPLRAGRQLFGREAGCDIVLDDATLSRRHLSIDLRGNLAVVEDLSSKNGLWMDGERVDRLEVRPEQWFVAGTVLFAVRRGVSLVSLEGWPGPVASERAAALSPTVEPMPPAVASSARGWSAELASVLESTAGEEPGRTLVRLLESIARRANASGAALLEQIGSGWSLLALAGLAPPVEIDEALALSLPGRGPLESAAARLWPIPDGRGAGLWLCLHPGPLDRSFDDDLRLGAVLAAQLAPRSLPHDGRAASPSLPSAAFAPRMADPSLVGVSGAFLSLLGEVDRLAATALPVLLRGESGTGKELLARRLHLRSARAQGPFVAINCAAIPNELIEAELFGIDRGVATGVTGRVGLLVRAHGGTLFLDEVGDLPPSLQPKLLRALESNEVLPVGSPSPIPVEVRIVAATHQDLSSTGFRRDLLYRVAGATIEVPPLRARPEDILPLARAFACEAGVSQGRTTPGFDLEAARLLLGYHWPGNVRELKHAITRAVALSDGPVMGSEVLPRELAESARPERGDYVLGLRGEYREARERFEHLYFRELLERCSGAKPEACRRSGLSRSAFYAKLTELGL